MRAHVARATASAPLLPQDSPIGWGSCASWTLAGCKSRHQWFFTAGDAVLTSNLRCPVLVHIDAFFHLCLSPVACILDVVLGIGHIKPFAALRASRVVARAWVGELTTSRDT